jgi:hypothetical protein
MADELAHVHVGPGCLGLGLVAATTLEAGMDVHLVGRPGCRLDKDRLSVAFHGDHGQRHASMPLPVRTVSAADSYRELESEAQDAVRSAPHLLLTTSLGRRGLRDGGAVLLDILRQRPKELRPTTVCIAAEGDPGGAWSGLEGTLSRRGVDCRRTVVNRLCYPSPRSADPAACEVFAEDFAEWVISGEPDQPLLEALDGVDHTLFTEDIEPYRMRRHWLVDSGQLAVALRARRLKMTHTPADEKRFGWLARFYEPILRAYEQRPDALGDSRDYVQDHIQIWIRHDHDLQRILQSSLLRADLIPFLDEVERKLLEPLMAVRALDLSWVEAVDVFETLDDVLNDFDQYVDGPALDRDNGPLSKEHDDEALGRYARIVGRVFEDSVALDMVQRLTRSFEDDRARYG